MPTISEMSENVNVAIVFIFSLLIFFTIFFSVLDRTVQKYNFQSILTRIKSWWVIFGIFFSSLMLESGFFFAVMAFVSFTAYRELISAVGFRQEDRWTLLIAYLAIPTQYVIAYYGNPALFYSFLPAFLLVVLSCRLILSKNTNGIIRSFSTIHWGLLVTTYSLSHIPFLMTHFYSQERVYFAEGIVIFFIFLAQFNDVLQFLWGKTMGRRKIIPSVSPNKTVAGFVGALISTMALAVILAPITPFSVVQAVMLGMVISCFGFMGDLFVSAIKRDLKIKDMSNFLPGHGGIFDRVDSLTLSSILFFHLASYMVLK